MKWYNLFYDKSNAYSSMKGLNAKRKDPLSYGVITKMRDMHE